MIQLQLTIPEPCHQDWNEMSPNEKGRFCSSCAKTVVDFSSMTDTQLIEYFVQLKGQDVCGSVHPEQLHRTISSLPVPPKTIFRYWQYAAASLLLFFKAPQAKAQGWMSSKIKVVETEKKLTAKKIVAATLLKRIAVTDMDLQPIPGASIRFLSDDNLLMTDSSGKIYLNKTDENETLIISAVGFEERTIRIKDIEFGTVKMIQDIRSLENVTVEAHGTNRTYVTLGGMGYRAYRISYVKDSVAKITNFLSPSIAAYPNPVVRGNALNVSLKIKQAGICRFYIYDVSGRLLMAQNHQVSGKTFIQPLIIPAAWSRGTYFIVVAGEDRSSIGKTKIVVQ